MAFSCAGNTQLTDLRRHKFINGLFKRMAMERTNTDRIFEILFNEDEITWQSIIYELVKSEEMDPWDINLSLLSKQYIETLKKLQSFDVRISGKVVLAAAILLNIKSTKLLDEESKLDELINPPADVLDEDEELGYQRFSLKDLPSDKITLIPRTPQPRKRKISVFDLVEALQKALDVKKRRILRETDVPEMPVIDKKVDITKIIMDLHKKIKQILSEKNVLTFFELAGSERKEDQVSTLVPLLHLTTQGKIDINQNRHFEDIDIRVKNE